VFRVKLIDNRSGRIPIRNQAFKNEQAPVSVAVRIIGDLVELRDTLKDLAEGLAVLDFVQGHVATDLPVALACDIVAVLRNDRSPASAPVYVDDLVIFWLENYRRAYSQMIMRVLEDGADSLTP
jgi:hypothetical protein